MERCCACKVFSDTPVSATTSSISSWMKNESACLELVLGNYPAMSIAAVRAITAVLARRRRR
jgi:hypothetical protein